ncbi:tRNA (adenosine(37)-N6)-dimethylallyltransferase MiaA, partial [Candidatus Pacearchaeota archaeon]
MSLKKIVLISGPTATGKTKLAVKLTKIFPALLISADSRQVYQGMDIVTGKDHPPQIKLACLDILKPDEKISVALWRQCALKAIASAYSQNQLPIIVGGTNFYLKSLTSNIETITIPPNLSLRRILSAKTAVELQAILNKLNPTKLKRMNNSDRHNPRRLIRAIEVATYYQTHSSPPPS